MVSARHVTNKITRLDTHTVNHYRAKSAKSHQSREEVAPHDRVSSAADRTTRGGRGRQRAYLSIIHLADAEESIKRVVGRDDEAGRVDEELATDVEEDEEEVDAGEPKKDVYLFRGCELGTATPLETSSAMRQEEQAVRPGMIETSASKGLVEGKRAAKTVPWGRMSVSRSCSGFDTSRAIENDGRGQRSPRSSLEAIEKRADRPSSWGDDDDDDDDEPPCLSARLNAGRDPGTTSLQDGYVCAEPD